MELLNVELHIERADIREILLSSLKKDNKKEAFDLTPLPSSRGEGESKFNYRSLYHLILREKYIKNPMIRNKPTLPISKE
jgi:hypothetical protein